MLHSCCHICSLAFPTEIITPETYIQTGISEDEKKRLLHCVVVGGGPTGVEFSGELSDFIIKDVHERYSHVKDYINVTLIEVSDCSS